ncbi:hypothetical protein ACWCO6_29750, partial [Streptomyces sp. NPDC001809]
PATGGGATLGDQGPGAGGGGPSGWGGGPVGWGGGAGIVGAALVTPVTAVPEKPVVPAPVPVPAPPVAAARVLTVPFPSSFTTPAP